MMYQWIWSKLPGGRIIKALSATALVAFVVFALFAWGFPALDTWFSQNPIVSE